MDHDPKLEFETASENARHYENLFFAHLTVFITVTAALAAVAFQTVPANMPINLSAKLLGLIFTGTAWLNATIYLGRAYHLLDRIVTLEKQLGFKIYSGLPEQRIAFFAKYRWLRPGGLSWHALYAGVSIFWIVALQRHFGIGA